MDIFIPVASTCPRMPIHSAGRFTLRIPRADFPFTKHNSHSLAGRHAIHRHLSRTGVKTNPLHVLQAPGRHEYSVVLLFFFTSTTYTASRLLSHSIVKHGYHDHQRKLQKPPTPSILQNGRVLLAPRQTVARPMRRSFSTSSRGIRRYR